MVVKFRIMQLVVDPDGCEHWEPDPLNIAFDTSGEAAHALRELGAVPKEGVEDTFVSGDGETTFRISMVSVTPVN